MCVWDRPFCNKRAELLCPLVIFHMFAKVALHNNHKLYMRMVHYSLMVQYSYTLVAGKVIDGKVIYG